MTEIYSLNSSEGQSLKLRGWEGGFILEFPRENLVHDSPLVLVAVGNPQYFLS